MSAISLRRRGVRPSQGLYNRRMYKRQRMPATFVGPLLPGQFRASPSNRMRIAKSYRTGGLSGLELKYIDNQYAATNLTNTLTTTTATHDPSATITINGTAQGDGFDNRDGIIMTTKSVGIVGQIVVPAVEVQDNLNCSFQYRIALVLDKQTNGAAASADLIWDDTATVKTNAFRKIENAFRFDVLKEIKGRWNPPSVVNTASVINSFGYPKVTIPFKIFYTFPGGLKTRYSSTTNTIANIRDNSLHIYAWVDTVTTTPQTISYTSRARFIA